jgi:eukaryotic-like serine/threonine-protein kinase
MSRAFIPEGKPVMTALHGTSGGDLNTVPGCEIVGTISEGGMGKVYLARQHALKRFVCVKVLAIPEGEDADLCRARFYREAELLASASHPHILSIFDFGTTTDSHQPFLVTEYIEGGDLRRLMIPGEAMPIGQARSILLQVGEALTFLHGKGILHRDLKPENVLMPTSSLVKLGDLGIAVLQEEAGVLTKTLRGMGTVGYVSPEQQYGLKVDERTDQFSLAALSYELMTGRRALGVFPPPSQLNPNVNGVLDAVVLRGLSEDPKDRYTSVEEFVTALDRALAPSSRSVARRPLAIFGSIAILFGVAGLAWMLGLGFLKVRPIQNPPNRPDPTAAHPDRPPPAAGADEPSAKAEEQSPEYNRLVELRAYAIWDRIGRPTGAAGEAVRVQNWTEAERQIRDEVKDRAYKIWVKQGSPMGERGALLREANMRKAEAELLEETEAELRRHPIS